MQTHGIHVAITRVVKPGCERAFEEAILDFFTRTIGADGSGKGSLGAQLLRPMPGGNERQYGILRSFRSEAERDEFYGSEDFTKWQERIAPLVEVEYSRKELHGLEAFFSHPETLGHPPRWKMAIVTWLGVWPTAYIVNGATDPVSLIDPTGWLKGAATAATVVALLTWIVMPRLSALFKRWLRSQPKTI